MEMILTPEKKNEILYKVMYFLENNLNKKISVPIIIDPTNEEKDLTQREKFLNFSKMMEKEGPIWTDENHPDLKTIEDIIGYVNNIRKQ